ncbi:2-C-methyl-D-erythritol 4-phosphate cytidylyltransferase [Caldanaerobius fijiensis DSM 17918]|uniref:2-C-methyl-D-erythritol 4-phosphate cytidylyltransferase n=1 Tax=Caldanaerobius fijiensis DSM 17918 TaxID=1121256 RepID=A0A1M5BXY2_9THEO|nr:2-C-methyl-D-erythritol 4-phosphate cytidylyltransferase [Caldanaerobius fijiensis]SHF47072.1 2-C-methyl-D-erythritol 4-phosphate cytidylyltransferase [Caldanaerobius fijiensis DSM 17918]
MKVCALIMAAGKGRRMQMDKNKVFLPLNGKPIITYSVETIKKSGIDDIVVVTSKDDIDFCSNEILKGYEVRYVEGGAERQISVYNGLMAIKETNCDLVLIHDGARPFVTESIIRESIEAAIEHGAAAVGVKVKDTIKVVKDGFILHTPPRESLWAVQTPQVFRYDLILKAHQKAIEDNFLSTDDTVLVERMGIKVRMIEGAYRNIKITTPEDIYIAEALASMN